VNNDTWPIVPNSLKYVGGKGEKNVRPQSSGGGNVDAVVTENAETKLSQVMFEMTNTKGNIERYEEAQESLGGLTVEFADALSGLTKSFANMSVTNDSEITLSQDGNIVVEMKGSPAQ
jgi:hypothetical protein